LIVSATVAAAVVFAIVFDYVEATMMDFALMFIGNLS
jgi:hypothetical protein